MKAAHKVWLVVATVCFAIILGASLLALQANPHPKISEIDAKLGRDSEWWKDYYVRVGDMSGLLKAVGLPDEIVESNYGQLLLYRCSDGGFAICGCSYGQNSAEKLYDVVDSNGNRLPEPSATEYRILATYRLTGGHRDVHVEVLRHRTGGSSGPDATSMHDALAERSRVFQALKE